MTKKYRVEIDEEVFRALRVEAAKTGITTKELASQILKNSLDKSTFDYIESSSLSVKKTKAPQRSKSPKDQKPPLREDNEAQQKIRELWGSGERNRAEIARQIDRPNRSVQKWIKEAIEKGELSVE